MAKAKVVIDQNKCKGCGLCTTACPKKILALSKEKINAKGYNPCEVIDIDSCIGCAFCATMCPDVAIRVER
ncbi:4Fe-4S dicluster domain-containing protein [Candidatus Soleaferrea massiliensis]|uniref:4Fe-4S dicluster domain-containing protein n=1 Tax=Candidatus Soleaferrea massiliensis TaxID=1470354 RepID=UPI00058B6EA5|nr:4Fe-4S binding protein [Candidatus Soleaferrea massiliensis]